MSQSDQILSNFIKTKLLKEGENKEQKERSHVQARKQGGQARGVGKSDIVDPTIIRSMLEKERGSTV